MSITRKDRLRVVYDYLREHFGIHTQRDLADVLDMTRPALSAAMNGNESYLTDNLFKKICAAYQGVFNLDYLLTGDGELLAKGTRDTHTPAPASGESELWQQLLASKDETIAALKNDLRTRDDLITQLHARIADLERQITMGDLTRYPFTHSPTEHDERQQQSQL